MFYNVNMLTLVLVYILTVNSLPDELFSGASAVRSNMGTRDVEERASGEPGDSELCRFSLEWSPSAVNCNEKRYSYVSIIPVMAHCTCIHVSVTLTHNIISSLRDGA